MTPLDSKSGALDGMVFFKLDVRNDPRGWFKENWQKTKMDSQGLRHFTPVQHNLSFNQTKGTARGLHAEPWDKLVSVATGRVFGVWLDLREGEGFGSIDFQELGPGDSVFIPKGVANGFQTLEDETTYSYLVNDHWTENGKYEMVSLFDSALNIPWPLPLSPSLVSDKDLKHPPLSSAQPIGALEGFIVGSDGQLGRAVSRAIPSLVPLSRSHLDISSQLPAEVLRLSPGAVVVNCAAFTNVEGAEDPSKSSELYATNVRGVGNLASACLESSSVLVHISSDYVFDGKEEKPYSEDTNVSPVSKYGMSKAAGDSLASVNPKTYIFRTSWVFGDGKNFIKSMASLAKARKEVRVVDDQFGRPTSARTLAAAIGHILESRSEYGIYNLSCEGPIVSWFELAQFVYQAVGSSTDLVQPVSTQEYFSTQTNFAPRPHYSALDLGKIQATGFLTEDWRHSVSEYLSENF